MTLLAVQIIKKVHVAFIIGTVATLIVFLVGFYYMEIVMNTNLVLFIIFFSLAIGGLIRIRKKYHQGQLPIFLGVILFLGGGILFIGTFSFDYIDTETNEQKRWMALWDLNFRQAGIFLLLTIGGILTAFFGGKQAIGSSYFWGSVKSRGK